MASMLHSKRPANSDWSKRSGPFCLAIVGMLSLARLRFSCEEPLNMGLEAGLQIGWLVWLGQKHASIKADNLADKPRSAGYLPRTVVGLAGLTIFPWFIALAMRALGRGTGLELIMLSSFGWTTLGASLLLEHRRALSTAVICSGFLTLLATCSSDQAVAILFAYAWGAMCLWFLASSHWQRLANCQANTVTENRASRPLTVLLGGAVFMLAAWSVAGRFPGSMKPGIEVMPTSGGSTINDAQASGGVGDGEAVVAAREHAASFGAVDSDVFLDSDQPSLFDLYSDAFGEPLRKDKTERTVALAPQEMPTPQPDTMAQSDQGSSKLTTQRRGTPNHRPQKSSVSNALLFWIGRHDMHLPIRRYSRFDGQAWSQQNSSVEPVASSVEEGIQRTFATSTNSHTLTSEVHHERVWFSWPIAQAQLSGRNPSPFVGAEAEAIKFARLRSNAIPAPAGMAKWHIDKVDDPTLFTMDHEDNLSMPGRQRVPEYTIVRYVNRLMDIEQIEAVAATSSARAILPPPGSAPENSQHLMTQLLDDWLSNHAASRWSQIETIVDHLRADFALDRQHDFSNCQDPVAEFLTVKAGSDLMFATTAAAMLKRIGIESRLVTGLIARDAHRLGLSHEIAIYPEDMHAWLEVCLAPGCWIPLEPTPGYPQPQLHVSWRYWLKAHAWSIALGLLAVGAAWWALWWLRARVFDAACSMSGALLWFFSDRLRCRLILGLLDMRARLIGSPRPSHVSPRTWYGGLIASSPLEVRVALQQLLIESDRMWFGQGNHLSSDGRRACSILWYRATCKCLNAEKTEVLRRDHGGWRLFPGNLCDD